METYLDDKREQAVEAAFEFIEEYHKTSCSPIPEESWDAASEWMADFAIEYATAEGIPQADGWVAIETGLPDTARIVKVTIAGLGLLPTTREGYFAERMGGWNAIIMSDKYEQLPGGIEVTAWMELPPPIQPYQRQSSEGE